MNRTIQSKKGSLVEILANVGSGYILAWLVSLYMFPLIGFDISIAQNTMTTSIFTVISVARGYVWRRLFNWHSVRSLHESA